MEYQGNFNCFVNTRICYVPNELIRVKFPPWKDNKSDVLSVSPSSENHFTQMKGQLLKYQLHHLCTEEVWLLSTCLIPNFSVSLPRQCCTTASLRSNLSLVVWILKIKELLLYLHMTYKSISCISWPPFRGQRVIFSNLWVRIFLKNFHLRIFFQVCYGYTKQICKNFFWSQFLTRQ